MTKPRTSKPAAEQELVRHAEFLRRVARSLIRAEDADDLAHESLLAGWGKAPRDGARVEGWLRRICRNVYRQRVRVDDRRSAREERSARRERWPSTLEMVEHREAARAIVDAVARLDDPAYVMIELRYFEGLPPRAIAARTGLPVATVKRRLERALARVRASLEAGEGRGSRGIFLLAGIPWPESLRAATAAADAGLAKAAVKGVLMTKKISLGALVVAITCGVGWFLVESTREPAPRDPARATAQAAPETVPPTTRAPTISAIETARFTGADNAEAREQVLARADRDLDVFGWVVDENGAPVAGATVQTLRFPWQRLEVLNVDGRWEVEEVGRATTDELGVFILRHRRGAIVHLRVGKPGFATQDVSECQAGEKVIVTLGRAASLTVRAITQDGAPIPRAGIRFWRKGTRLEGKAFDHRRGETEADGRYRIPDLATGEGVVEVTHPDYRVDRTPVVVSQVAEHTVDVVMRAGQTVTGRVTDRVTGRPIFGARVGDGPFFPRSVTTDADGRYTLRGCGRIGGVHVVAAGYCRRDSLRSADGQVDFELEPGDMVTGRVIGADGAPVPGARLTAVASAWGPNRVWEMDTVSTVPDTDGTFTLEGIRHDLPHTLVIQAEDHARMLLDFNPHPGGPGTVSLGDIRLPEARMIEGRALSSAGSPFVGVTIRLTGENADRARLTGTPAHALGLVRYGREETRRTDDLGRFRFPDLAPGCYEVALQRDGAAPLAATVVLEPGRDVLDLELRAGESEVLVVRLRDDAGAPVGGVEVKVFVGQSRDGARTMSDEEGRASFEGVPPGVEALVRVDPGPRPYEPVQPRRLDGTAGEIEITLTRAGIIAGRVIGPDGAPVPGLQIDASSEGASIPGAIADDEGAFEIRSPHGALVDLAVRGYRFPPGMSRAEATHHRGQLLGIRAPAADVVLRTRIPDAARSLWVRVVDPAGSPSPEASVWVPGRPSIPTDDKGVAEFTDLIAEEVEVVAGAPKDTPLAGSRKRRVLPEGQTITLSLRPAVEVTGLVVDGADRPVARANLNLTAADGSVAAARTDSEGRFRVKVVAGIPHDVMAWQIDPSTGANHHAQLRGVTGGEITLRLE